jgi:hypothetical protein
MTFRAVVQDGLIVVNTHGTIPDGTPVDISIAKRKRGTPKRPARKRAVSSRKNARRTPLFGIWADWDELGGPEEALDRFRALTRRRRIG